MTDDYVLGQFSLQETSFDLETFRFISAMQN